jgi:hypothetical protein
MKLDPTPTEMYFSFGICTSFEKAVNVLRFRANRISRDFFRRQSWPSQINEITLKTPTIRRDLAVLSAYSVRLGHSSRADLDSVLSPP